MRNKAKLAGQRRHSITTLGGGIMTDALVGAELINKTLDQVNLALAQMGLDVALSVPPGAEFILGLVVAAIGFVKSWRDRAKTIGEGDPK